MKPVTVDIISISIYCGSHSIFLMRTPRRNLSRVLIMRIRKFPEQITLLLFPGPCKLHPSESIDNRLNELVIHLRSDDQLEYYADVGKKKVTSSCTSFISTI